MTSLIATDGPLMTSLMTSSDGFSDNLSDDLSDCLPQQVSKERTTMIATGKYTEQVNERIKVIKKEMENTDSEFDREKCQERIAKLGGAIGRIKVGAATETELKDKKLRYEDALNSVKAAMDEGIVPGGGSTLVYLLRTKDKVMPI
jgi:chaperonin GroEL